MCTLQVRLLIDPGSELSFITEQLIQQLKFPRQHSKLSIVGIGGKSSTQTRGCVPILLKSVHSSEAVEVTAHILHTLTTILPTFQTITPNWPHLNHLQLADPDFLTPRPIDLIVGADAYGQLIKNHIIKGSSTMPIAQLSIFGWLILGPVNSSQSTHSAHYSSIEKENESLQELLIRFWQQEEVPQSNERQLTPEENECESHFKDTHQRDSQGRYIVRLPLKSPASRLGNSYYSAHQCVQSMIRRLNKDQTLKDLYLNFMREYEMLGHMVKATAKGNSQPVYYLPHHGVLKPDSSTTKLRVVFNGSSTTTSGISLNDLMHTGANLHLEISDVLTWIRQYRHIFATDVTKMYRQIKVNELDWDLQRILWLDENNHEVSYNLTTVTYGTKAAPFLAVRALLQLAEDEGNNFPLAIPSITFGRYVDDIFGGADTIPHLIKIAHQLIELCKAGGFPLAKWFATQIDFLRAIQPDSDNSDISFDDCETKILGIKWKPHDDVFTFSSKARTISRSYSKRHILSEVAQIFDPLGFSSPVVIKAKMFLQELWLHKLKWDDPLPSQLISRWLIIREDLKCLARLSIPRWFNTMSNSSVELHGFSDASQLAMAAVIYITVHSSSTTHSAFVWAKTKVAPLKRLTIPRLELTAALMLAKLMKHVQATLKVNIAAIHLWTDSQVTLMWIKSHPSRWKEFVRNRVAQIQDLSSNAHWRHVPGSSNPADCASRGLSTKQLIDYSLWWKGPPWIAQPMHQWPVQHDFSGKEVLLEARSGISLAVTTFKETYQWHIIFKYSSLIRLFRITALCFRLIAKLKRNPINLSVSEIEVDDLEKAKSYWIKVTQKAFFSSELKVLQSENNLPRTHVFSKLTAFVDSDGIIRVGGRLNFADISYDTKHPAILPQHSRLSTLIIDHAHKKTFHGGTQITMAYIRQSYWIIGGRRSIKSHVLRCMVCARQRGIRAQQLMGQLPLCRVTPSRAFSHTGVDYAGPLTIKAWRGRGSKMIKGWICVFVCLFTSAVHLEIATDYSTEGFIAIYRRFSSRRGLPSCLYSDCGTNFQGAEKALQQLFIQGTKENQRIAAMLSNDQTHWKFNPPAAPHMGGKWEAAVKSIKFHLKRTLNDVILTYEEFNTLLTQIEGLLNSRPLEPLSDDPDDISALTPGHFLIGSSLISHPEPSLLPSQTSRMSNWKLIQQRTQQFWSQWSTHYIHRLQTISKWHHINHQIKIGSLVLISDERLPPSKWPLARVIDVTKGADGLIRVVTVKTATTTLIRPLTKLTILPRISEDRTSSHQPTG